MYFLISKSATALRSKADRDTNLQISDLKEEDAGKFTCIIDGNIMNTRCSWSQSQPTPPVSCRREQRLRCSVGSEVTTRWRSSGGVQKDKKHSQKPFVLNLLPSLTLGPGS
ncbi:hypothetical protein F7725_017979, partial [Dissostichus mawsoni]